MAARVNRLFSLVKSVPIFRSNLFKVYSSPVYCHCFSVKTKDLRAQQSLPDALSSDGKSVDQSDIFGDFDISLLNAKDVLEDPDDIQEAHRQKLANRLKLEEYVNMMREHLNRGDYEAARNVMMERMYKIDKAKPDRYVYNILLYYCGKVGNYKDAFKLFNDMKKRGLKPTGAAYTSLYSACANTKRSRHAIKIADKVTELLATDTFHKMNITNYNAMLKAYGRHGELKKCFNIVDEVLEKRGKIRDDTYNFLLQSCITDKNSGFRHALLVWHKMLQNNTRPSIYSFNLLLRSVRDCALGDKQFVDQLIESIMKEGDTRKLGKLSVPIHKLSKKQLKEFQKGKPSNLVSDPVINRESNQLQTMNNDDTDLIPKDEFQDPGVPNLLSVTPTTGTVVTISNIDSAFDRLLLVGGPFGFLKTMEIEYEIKPNIKTLTLLLDIIPNTLEAEMKLLLWMEKQKIEGEVTFYNMLMRRRCYRLDYQSAKDLLSVMSRLHLAPNLITFGVLAMTCQTKEEAEVLVEDARSAGFRLNAEILGTFLSTACHKRDYLYVNKILQITKEEEIEPTPRFYAHLDRFVHKEKTLIASEDKKFHSIEDSGDLKQIQE